MKINDKVYGNFEIKEDVLTSLIKSSPLERLKNIEQFGLPEELYHFSGFTRYEHSVGVFLLLRDLNASLEEQIAGLLHDVSHTALSHVIDWAIGDREREEFHDENHERFIYNTEIPEILSDHGLKTERIIDDENFPLLERDLPELCADRIDYTLRELNVRKGSKIVEKCVESLDRRGDKIVFDRKEIAKQFGEKYRNLQEEHWGGPRATLRYHLMGKALKLGLREGIIEEKDLYKTDSHVIEKLRDGNNKEINNILQKLEGEINFRTNVENPDFSLKKKFRYIDPLYIENEEVKRLSQRDEEYRKMLKDMEEKNKRGINVKIIS